ncbi:MAG TPA: hypothetical protein VFS20_06780 [Longimicrobium sp.]|nr:hypothetical protein [Longimicrobium sp.]
MTNRAFGRLARLASLALLPAALAACNDDPSLPPGNTSTRLEVIVNSISNSLTLVSADSVTPSTRTVSLGAQGSPVGAAVRREWAIVPLGTYPFAAVVDLRSGTVTRTVGLPANSGATGAGFVNDSIAFVGNPARNTVSPVNVRSGVVGAEVQVGTYPHAIVEGFNAVFVLNANLVNFAPAGPGSVSVINAAGQVVATIPLSGINPTDGVVVGNTLVVINSGEFGKANGSLSLVSLATGTEVAHIPGFGEFPGSVDVGPDGLVYVGVYGSGILVWNPGSGQFVRGPNNPLVPGGAPPVADIAFDYLGRLHTLNPGNCTPGTPGKEYGLAQPYTSVERTVATGVCPFSIDFTVIPTTGSPAQ